MSKVMLWMIEGCVFRFMTHMSPRFCCVSGQDIVICRQGYEMSVIYGHERCEIPGFEKEIDVVVVSVGLVEMMVFNM